MVMGGGADHCRLVGAAAVGVGAKLSATVGVGVTAPPAGAQAASTMAASITMGSKRFKDKGNYLHKKIARLKRAPGNIS
jgi:hypothetical protein